MKRTQSIQPMPTYEPSGSEVTIFWDGQVIKRTTDDGTETVYDYAYCVAPRAINYGSLVSAIIRSQYSESAELAAINNRDSEYQAFRHKAKVLARGYLGIHKSDEDILQAKRESMKVSRFQALAALDEFGYLEAAEALIASDQATTKCKLAWKNALEFRRLSPMVLSMAPLLEISPEKLDEIFDYAKTVEA